MSGIALKFTGNIPDDLNPDLDVFNRRTAGPRWSEDSEKHYTTLHYLVKSSAFNIAPTEGTAMADQTHTIENVVQ